MSRSTIDVRSITLGWGLLILTWCGLSYLAGVPDYLLASPTRVTNYLLDEGTGLALATLITGSQALVGWLLGILLGLSIGAVLFYIPVGRTLLLPPLVALQTTPVIALAPLITFWFGYGWSARMVVAGIISTFPLAISTYTALGDTKPSYIYTYKLAGATEVDIFLRVRLRSAWSAILSSLKTAMVLAVIGSIVADFMGGNNGLGFLIMKATYSSNGAMLVSAIIASAILGQVFLMGLERVIRSWENRYGW